MIFEGEKHGSTKSKTIKIRNNGKNLNFNVKTITFNYISTHLNHYQKLQIILIFKTKQKYT